MYIQGIEAGALYKDWQNNLWVCRYVVHVHGSNAIQYYDYCDMYCISTVYRCNNTAAC